jgi:hypothetical protein
MLKLLWEWIVAPLVAAVLCGALLEILHPLGYYPERWLAGLIMRHPSEKAQKIAFWGLVAISALGTLLLVNWFLPLESPPSGGVTIKDNQGIITKGQTGDNTLSK